MVSQQNFNNSFFKLLFSLQPQIPVAMGLKYFAGNEEFSGCWLINPNLTPQSTHPQLVINQHQLPGLPWRSSGEEPASQCRRCRFGPWSGKIPHATEQWPKLQSLLSRAMSHNNWSPWAWSPRSTTREPQGEARAPQPERGPRGSEDPAQPAQPETNR